MIGVPSIPPSVATTADRALARGLVLRDWRPRILIPLLGASALFGGLIGYMRAATATSPSSPESFARIIGDTYLLIFSNGMGALLALFALILVLHRFGSDHEVQWLHPLVAAGAGRATYAGVVVASAIALASYMYAAATLGHAIGGAFNGPFTVTRHVGLLPGTLALIAACAVYGAAVATIARARAHAFMVGLLGIFVPLMLLLTHNLRTGNELPSYVTRLVLLHLPRFSLRTDPFVLGHQLAYICIVLALVLYFAERRTGREW